MIVSEIARQVLSDVASDAGHILAASWVSQRYVEALTRFRPRHLRQVGEVVQPATIQTGTVTTVQGSHVVTPDADALAAWNLIPITSLVGRFFRGQDATWYEIEAVESGTLILKSPYVLVGAAEIGYNIAARYLELAPDARWLGDFMHMRLWRELETIPLDVLDIRSPARPWAQGVPSVAVDLGVQPGRGGQKSVRLVEIYPYAKQDELLHYVYWQIPPFLQFTDEVPQFMPDYVLKEGALVNAMRYEAAKAIRTGQVEQATYWRNEYRAQETTWKKKIEDLARADKGVDDVSFIIQGYGSRYNNQDGYIRTAHDEAFARFWG